MGVWTHKILGYGRIAYKWVGRLGLRELGDGKNGYKMGAGRNGPYRWEMLSNYFKASTCRE
jgi:hypothetical protein